MNLHKGSYERVAERGNDGFQPEVTGRALAAIVNSRRSMSLGGEVQMFVPEIVKDNCCILVHNHDLTTRRSVDLAARFARARVAHGTINLSQTNSRIEIVFDVRGQKFDDTVEMLLSAEALGCASVTFFRD